MRGPVAGRGESSEPTYRAEGWDESANPDDVMPRVGLAFKLDNKTVIRSGYGLFYQYMENLGDAEYIIGNAPLAAGVTLTGSTTTPIFRLATGPAPGATDLAKADLGKTDFAKANPGKGAPR